MQDKSTSLNEQEAEQNRLAEGARTQMGLQRGRERRPISIRGNRARTRRERNPILEMGEAYPHSVERWAGSGYAFALSLLCIPVYFLSFSFLAEFNMPYGAPFHN